MERRDVTNSRILLLGLALFCSQAFAAPASDSDFVTSLDDISWTGIAICVFERKFPLDCVEQRSKRAAELLLKSERESEAARGMESEHAFDKDVESLVDQLSETTAEAAEAVMERRIRGIASKRSLSSPSEYEESNSIAGEGRGKKKKKLKKLIHLLKLVILVVLVKLKIAFILMKLQTLFQLKLVIMTAIILLIQKIKLWTELKHKHDPQKVIYYEHAQHQHHYDGDHWGHDDHEHDSSGGSGWSLWGRSYDTAAIADKSGDDTIRRAGVVAGPGTVAFPGLPGIQSGIYRAADGTRLVIGQPVVHSAQDLAYSAHRR